MNEIQMYETLKGMPKETLIRYAQNPTGGVPQYMAIAALQYQKSIENSQPVKQPQGTVAQEVVRDAFGIPSVRHGYNQQPQQEQQPQQAQPPAQPEQMASGGVASLNVPDDMFAEEYAGGGIVAFDEGGHVPKYAGVTDGSLVSSMPGFDTALSSLIQQRNALQNELTRLSGSASGQLDSDSAIVKGLLNAPFRAGYNLASGITSGLQNLSGRIGNVFAGKPVYKTNIDYGKLTSPESKADLLQEKIAQLDTAIAQTQKQGAMPVSGQAPTTAPSVSPTPSGITTPRISGDLKPYSITPFTPDTIPTTQTQKELEDAEKQAGTWDEFLARQSEKRSSAGIKDVYEQQLADIKSEKEKLSGDKKEAGWMAALEAGLAVTAGTSPYALQNLGAGALKGINSYKDSLKEIKQNEKELRREGNALERDQQTMLESRLRGDETSYQAALDRVQGRRDRLQQLDAQNTVIKNAAKEYTAKETTEASKTAFTQTQENKRAQANIVAHIEAAKISAEATTRAAIAKILAGQQLDPLEKGRLNKLADEAYDSYVGDPANKGKTLMSREIFKQNYFATMGSGGMGGRAPATGKLIAGKDGVLKYSDEES